MTHSVSVHLMFAYWSLCLLLQLGSEEWKGSAERELEKRREEKKGKKRDSASLAVYFRSSPLPSLSDFCTHTLNVKHTPRAAPALIFKSLCPSYYTGDLLYLYFFSATFLSFSFLFLFPPSSSCVRIDSPLQKKQEKKGKRTEHHRDLIHPQQRHLKQLLDSLSLLSSLLLLLLLLPLPFPLLLPLRSSFSSPLPLSHSPCWVPPTPHE